MATPIPTKPAGDDPREAEFLRRRRIRNYALFFALLGLFALFYAITIVQMSR